VTMYPEALYRQLGGARARVATCAGQAQCSQNLFGYRFRVSKPGSIDRKDQTPMKSTLRRPS
jgi:hypothetical protein